MNTYIYIASVKQKSSEALMVDVVVDRMGKLKLYVCNE